MEPPAPDTVARPVSFASIINVDAIYLWSVAEKHLLIWKYLVIGIEIPPPGSTVGSNS